MMQQRSSLGFFTLLALTLLGCVTTPDPKAMQRIKRVAIIGFSATAKADDPSLKYILHPNDTGESLYKLIAYRLQQQHQWTVLPVSTVRGQETYRQLYKTYTSHLLNAGIRISGLLAAIESFNLSKKIRRKLLQDLNADAVAEVGFLVEASPPSAQGAADQASMSAKISFDLYRARPADSIWHVSSLPSRRQEPLPAVAVAWFKTPEERALAIAVNNCVTAMFEQQAELSGGAPAATKPSAPRRKIKI